MFWRARKVRKVRSGSGRRGKGRGRELGKGRGKGSRVERANVVSGSGGDAASCE